VKRKKEPVYASGKEVEERKARKFVNDHE